MKDENVEKLREINPFFFGDLYMECFDGWFNLLAEVGEFMKQYPTCHASQIKEKFAGLRIYVHGVEYDGIYKYLDDIERRSTTVCEMCGEKGKVLHTTYGWLKTKCKECSNGTNNNP